MHCSDEELLAHRDGELSALHNRRVRRHLESCWRCRTRLEAYDEQIHRLMVDMDEWPLPPEGWIRETKQKLGSRFQEYEAGFTESRWRRFAMHAAPAWAAAATLLIAIGGWYVWTVRAPGTLRTNDVISRAAAAERAIYERPVQQVFSIHISEIRPVRKAVSAQLKVWSDRESGRFASRLNNEDGSLRQALWRSGREQEFIYRTGGRTVVRQAGHVEAPSSLDSLAEYGFEPEEVESAFMHWMESRSWKPISVTSDISMWAAEDGSSATAEKSHSEDGSAIIRIIARRSTRKFIAVVTVDFESNSYLPRLQTIRFETPGRAVEFRLTTTSIKPVKRSELAAALFQPDPELETEPPAGRIAVRPRDSLSVPPANAPEEQLPDADPRAMQAVFVLHQAGACLGEAVRVSEEGGGTQVVRANGGGAIFRSEAGLGLVLDALAELRREPPPSQGANPELAVALRHAWAIRRLADDFASKRTPDSADHSFQLLASMIHDHAGQVRRELDAISGGPPGTVYRATDPGDWRKDASTLFEVLMRLDEVRREFPGDSHSALSNIYFSLDHLQAAFPLR